MAVGVIVWLRLWLCSCFVFHIRIPYYPTENNQDRTGVYDLIGFSQSKTTVSSPHTRTRLLSLHAAVVVVVVVVAVVVVVVALGVVLIAVVAIAHDRQRDG